MIRNIIQKTAWPMTPPAPWSAFHVLFLLGGLTGAVCLTRLLCGLSFTKTSASNPKHAVFTKTAPGQVLFLCGVLLAAGEIYKQLFLYSVVNEGRYDWWYFPFQLCSTPMYLCLAFPFLPRGKIRRTAAIYLQSFGFLGGIMALLEPSGLMHPYWTLTLHGLLWHILLVFIGFYSTASGLAGKDKGCFLPALLLFFMFCALATAINIATLGRADMFYISPYYPVTQVIFHEISLVLGIGLGIGVYLLSICAGAFLSRQLLEVIFRK